MEAIHLICVTFCGFCNLTANTLLLQFFGSEKADPLFFKFVKYNLGNQSLPVYL